MENIYKTLFPPCSKTPLISEMCIYITNNLCKWRLGTWGERCSTDEKLGRASLHHYSQENYINRKLFDKSMKFSILVVHDVINDISYEAKLNMSKNCHLWG